MGISDYGDHRLCYWCSLLQLYLEDLALSFIPVDCCFPARPLSLEYFTVFIIRQNKAISKILVDRAFIAKSSGDLEVKKYETKLCLQILCERDAHIIAFLLEPSMYWELPGLLAVMHPAHVAIVCKCNNIKSARVNSNPFFQIRKLCVIAW